MTTNNRIFYQYIYVTKVKGDNQYKNVDNFGCNIHLYDYKISNIIK